MGFAGKFLPNIKVFTESCIWQADYVSDFAIIEKPEGMLKTLETGRAIFANDNGAKQLWALIRVV